MTQSMVPSADPDRLAALHRYEILDTPHEPGFDQIVALASHICDAPIAVINLIEDKRQWFKAEVGLGIRETPLDISICRHFLAQPGVTVVPDMLGDDRLCANPLVGTGEGLRFYAGCLLQSRDGHGIGTLCVLDRRARDLSEGQRFALKALADQVMAQMELRLALKQKARLLEQKETLLKEVNHRTKNNLQLISSIIQLQLRTLQDPSAREALLDTSSRIRSMATLHERLYRADEADSVDLANFLETLAQGFQSTAPEGITFSVDAVSLAVSLDNAVPISLIVNELATNAIKYAYRDTGGGEIRITLERTDGKADLLVRDFGQGLPADFDIRRGRSLGMRVILALAGQLGADISMRNAHPGVECRLSFAPQHVQAADRSGQ